MRNHGNHGNHSTTLPRIARALQVRSGPAGNYLVAFPVGSMVVASVGRRADGAYHQVPDMRPLVQATAHEYLQDDLPEDGTAAWWMPLHTLGAAQARQQVGGL
jgi:hypothetical protein